MARACSPRVWYQYLEEVLAENRRQDTGDGTLTWVVSAPGYIGIDANLRRIDRNRVDNVRKVVAR